jgi:D-alanine-D-alanine ligase
MEDFSRKMYQCFFQQVIQQKDWSKLTKRQKKNVLEKTLSLSEGIGFPLVLEEEVYYHPADLMKALDVYLKTNEEAILTSVNAEEYVLIEEFIQGQEFSMGLIQDENFNVFALPPTEIYGEIETFDFKSKYQSEVTKKRIPIETHFDNLKKVETLGIKAFKDLGMNVICRIDGFVTPEDEIIFHDPNTLPGMSPTSLIFKQMAEIGLSITQSMNYLVRQSIAQRINEGKQRHKMQQLLKRIDIAMTSAQKADRKRVAVVFGENEEEYATAQKKFNEFAASDVFEPTCVCAAKNGKHYLIPVSMMYKANIQDFGQAISKGKHPFVQSLIEKTAGLREKYAGHVNFEVERIEEADLKSKFEIIYLAASDELKNV